MDRLETGRDSILVGAGGRTHRATAVVLAVAPDHVRRWLPHLVPRNPSEVRVACFDVALATVPAPRNAFVLGIDTPLYYSLHSQTARLAPEGGGVAHLLRYAPSAGA